MRNNRPWTARNKNFLFPPSFKYKPSYKEKPQPKEEETSDGNITERKKQDEIYYLRLQFVRKLVYIIYKIDP